MVHFSDPVYGEIVLHKAMHKDPRRGCVACHACGEVNGNRAICCKTQLPGKQKKPACRDFSDLLGDTAKSISAYSCRVRREGPDYR